MVMVAAGALNSAGVTASGMLFTYGSGAEGQLGHGDLGERLRPEQIGRELFGGQPVVMVACGMGHTMMLTVGDLWTCGNGEYGKLGHGDVTVPQLAIFSVATGPKIAHCQHHCVSHPTGDHHHRLSAKQLPANLLWPQPLSQVAVAELALCSTPIGKQHPACRHTRRV
mmetsp:Transcript_53269/g.86256  ORF Transcript_53269/g.86256 Transcript_53269/m.86256 type:complete len:168 (+) Transcript_53269:293-796(+)